MMRISTGGADNDDVAIGDRLTRSPDTLARLIGQGSDITSLAVRYSYVLPERHLLQALQALAPLVEMGAGTGYWAYLLRQMKTDIIAFDQSPPGGARANRYHPGAPRWTEVLEGDHSVLAAHRARTLFVCWPPLYSSLGECLRFYSGKTVAWLGDSGVRTALPAGLEEKFQPVTAYPACALDPCPEAPATLSIWRRRENPA